jgi:hypothetical protein
MKRQIPFEFAYQVTALILSIVLVHLAYITVIRPNADAILAEQVAAGRAGPALRPGPLAVRGAQGLRAGSLLHPDVLGHGDHGLQGAAGPEGAQPAAAGHRSRLRGHERAARGYPRLHPQHSGAAGGNPELPAAAHPARGTAAVRVHAQRSGRLRSGEVNCEAETDRLDSELSMVRYIAWAIPSIGFIGTVRGIGEALGQAYRAVEGDIAGVTASLGVAFNSTFTALVISIVVMFLMHQVQLIQERLVLDVQTYCDQRLLRHMQVRDA